MTGAEPAGTDPTAGQDICAAPATDAQQRRQPRAVRTRTLLLTAAATQFDRRGFHATSLRHISEAAGISRGALAFHFPTKDAIAAAVLAEHHHRVAAVLDDNTTAASAFEQMIRLTYRLADAYRHDVLVRAGLRLTDELGPAGPDPWRRLIEAVEQLACRAAAEQELRPELDPDQVAFAVVAVLRGVLAICAVLGDGTDLTLRVEQMWHLLRPALCAK